MNILMASIATQQQRKFQQHLQLAQQGDVEAQYLTADCFWEGKGVEQDLDEAFKWFQKAADQHSGKAKQRLGSCYMSGDGVEGDDGKGEKLYQESIPLLTTEATQGDKESMFLLSQAFYECRGVDLDDGQGLHWISKAADNGQAQAQRILGERYLCGEHGFPCKPEMAFNWFQRASENGDKYAQVHLADCYRRGVGVAVRDWIQALYWYQQATENGHWSGNMRINGLQNQISTKRNRLQDSVTESLKELSSSSLGLWGHGLARLVVQNHQPAGFTPTFVALKGLAPMLRYATSDSLKRPQQ